MNDHDHSTCKSLRSYLSDYVDGELSDELCQEIEQHTAGCDNCRVVVDTLRKTVSLYHTCAAGEAELSEASRAQLFKTLNLEDFLREK